MSCFKIPTSSCYSSTFCFLIFPSFRFSHHMIPGPPGPHTTGIPHPAIVTPQVKQEHPHTDSDLMHVWVRLSLHLWTPYGTKDLNPTVSPLLLPNRTPICYPESQCSSTLKALPLRTPSSLILSALIWFWDGKGAQLSKDEGKLTKEKWSSEQRDWRNGAVQPFSARL